MKPIEVDGDLVLSLASSVSGALNDTDTPFEYYFDITKENRMLKCAKAHKRTLLHEFIEIVCCENITYLLCKHFDREMIDYMEIWLDSLHISYDELKQPPLDCDYADDSYRDVEIFADKLQDFFNRKALPVIADAVFPILYNDKDFLYKFNCRITEQIKKLTKSDYPNLLEGDGYLKREVIPNWLKKGVFNRDRGRCQGCGTDLSRIFTNANAENYDHIIPLRQGGSNDPTNFQLMCEHCNKSKRDRSSDYRNTIWPYWEAD